MIRIVVAALLVVGCGNGDPTSFGVNVTVDASGIAAADVARITTANLTVSGVEEYRKSFDITTPIKTGQIRFRYIPKAQAGELNLTLDVTDAAGDIVASGASGTVDIVANKAVPSRIVLGEPPADMAPADASLDGGDAEVPMDLAPPTPPDMTVIQFNCLGMAKCVYECLNAGGDLNACDTQCSKNAKPGSATKWNNAVLCGQQYCVADADMMTGRCIEVADPGNPSVYILCDPGTTYAQCSATSYQSTSCLPCLDQARNRWIYDTSTNPPGPPTGMCSMPASADCTGAAALCGTQFSACLNDP